jgi:drug/metabolite transporter (DMT)-like permease
MPLTALALVLLSACTHATWNLSAKRAAGCRHFVFLYSALSVLLYLPIVSWILWSTRPQFSTLHWVALAATSVLHLGYSLALQAGYRASDLSLVYPLARGFGPLLSFFLAILLLGETPGTYSLAGVLLIVGGITLVSGLLERRHKSPLRGVLWGLCTGSCIAAYTINDGWAVSVLLISPFLVDYAGNLFRVLVLAPGAWQDRATALQEARGYVRHYATVSVLGPLGYILVLYAMQLAPVSHVAPARELSTLVGTLMGVVLLKEGISVARLLGVVCIVGGVVSLALLG